TWLARHPLQAGECLYAIFGSASDAAPLQAYYRKDSPPLPLPLWNGTPYADWQPVMPYLAKLSPSSVFLDWAASEKSRDWDENIQHDQKIRVGHQRHDTVEANSYSEFKAEEHRTTHAERKVEVRASDHLTVANDQHLKIASGQFVEAGQEIHLSSG
ncbi:DUF4123 domain-containing protein, partial [Pseudomonas aeruginosa]|uniref:DUF4123 domain-containing protein n=1 Tax=Pseudomonas aeruginosa TaxID=287 RepID=UPI001F24394B